MLSHGCTAPLPQLCGFAIELLDRVRTSFAGDQKELYLLFANLVCMPSESPGPVHCAIQRRLVPDDRICLTSYTPVVGPHTLPFPRSPASRWFARPTAFFAFLVSDLVCMSRWSLLLWTLGYML